jgi:hypothetical protein
MRLRIQVSSNTTKLDLTRDVTRSSNGYLMCQVHYYKKEKVNKWIIYCCYYYYSNGVYALTSGVTVTSQVPSSAILFHSSFLKVNDLL